MTATVIGEIKSITDEKVTGGFDKKILWLTDKKGGAFIDFRGNNRLLLKGFDVGDWVTVSFEFDGKISKIGNYYNNLIGTSIKKI